MSSVGPGALAAVVGTQRSGSGGLELLVRWQPGLDLVALPVEMATALLPAQTAAFFQATTFLNPTTPPVKTEPPPVKTEAPNTTKGLPTKAKKASNKTKETSGKTKETSDKTKETSDKTKETSDKTKETSDKTKETSDKTKETSDKTKETSNKTKKKEKPTNSKDVPEKPGKTEAGMGRPLSGDEPGASRRRKATSPPARSSPPKKARTEPPTVAKEAPKAATVAPPPAQRTSKPSGSLAKVPKSEAASGTGDGAGGADGDDSGGQEDREEPSDNDDDTEDDDYEDDDYEDDDYEDDYEDCGSGGEDSGSDDGEEDEAEEAAAAPKPMPGFSELLREVVVECSGPTKARGPTRTHIEHRLQRRTGDKVSRSQLTSTLAGMRMREVLEVAPGGCNFEGPFLCGPHFEQPIVCRERRGLMLEMLQGKPSGLSFDELLAGALEKDKAEGAMDGEVRTRYLLKSAVTRALKEDILQLGKGGTKSDGPFVLGPREFKPIGGDLARRAMVAVDGPAGFTRPDLYAWAKREVGWSHSIRCALYNSFRNGVISGSLLPVHGGDPKKGPVTRRR